MKMNIRVDFCANCYSTNHVSAMKDLVKRLCGYIQYISDDVWIVTTDDSGLVKILEDLNICDCLVAEVEE